MAKDKLPGFDPQGFKKAIDALGPEYERTISNAKTGSSDKPSTDKDSGTLTNKPTGRYTEEEWRNYYAGAD